MIVSTPPVFRAKPATDHKPSIFLAGSIEMGRAEDWQNALIGKIGRNFSIAFNPRRANFDPNWPQTIESENFNVQVKWELEMIKRADVVAFYFQPDTVSPITLLELGIVAASKPKSAFVCCPEGYHRKGNVDIVCEEFGLRTYSTFNKLVEALSSPGIPHGSFA